jgi:hypothetical protein
MKKCLAKHVKRHIFHKMTAVAPKYEVVPHWIDTSGRTRTWSVVKPCGGKLADTTTKQGAKRITELLNRVRYVRQVP